MSGSTSILIVDADRTARSSLAELLRDCSYDVVEAGSDTEAMEFAHSEPPALLVMDPWPSVGTALQLIQQLRMTESGLRTPVLLLSSVPDGDVDQRLLVRSMTRFLPKPSRASVLLSEIESMLGKVLD